MRRLLLSLSLSLAPVLFAQSAAPDLIIYDAKIFTGDPATPWAQAIAITGDHITAVGTNDQVRSMAARSTKSRDAQGRVVIPGLNDALVQQCTTPAFAIGSELDASGEDVRAAIAGAVDETPAEMWI